MTQYINKDALVAEIERFIERAKAERVLYPKTILAAKNYLLIEDYNKLLSFLDTLEVKEVDLEKELDKEWNKCEPTDEGMGLEIASIEHEQFDNIAKHFFELGLAKQTSEEIKIGETQIYLNDDGGEPPYDGKQWLDLSCTEYEIPEDKFKDGDDVELIIRKKQKGGKL